MINSIIQNFLKVRNNFKLICEPLEIEDYQVQTIYDVSPPKWHLAHTTWFFEEFILDRFIPNYKRFHPKYAYQFNSYYNHIGDRIQKDLRGMISRPTLNEVYKYRDYVDEQVNSLTKFIKEEELIEIAKLLLIGINHEQQHQELCLYDIKHIFYTNPLKPIYQNTEMRKQSTIEPIFIDLEAGLIEVGYDNKTDFAFDNEYPKHKVYLNPYRIQNRLITNHEYLEFVNDGAYDNFEIWLSDGWDFIKSNDIKTPMYWENIDGVWQEWTFSGYQNLDLNKPVGHISFFEADAFAKWKNKRLLTEFEWEYAHRRLEHSNEEGFFSEELDNFKVLTKKNDKNKIYQMNGYYWEWTSSPYGAYPGYKQAKGAIGEYNGKFMSSQMVLRGGSYASQKAHMRPSYRNFFQSDKRWLFNGIRLGDDI
jgi:ergothioneine biosynthesis protein EgtB